MNKPPLSERLTLRLSPRDVTLLRARAELAQLRPGAEARRLLVAALRSEVREARPA